MQACPYTFLTERPHRGLEEAALLCVRRRTPEAFEHFKTFPPKGKVIEIHAVEVRAHWSTIDPEQVPRTWVQVGQRNVAGRASGRWHDTRDKTYVGTGREE